MCAGAPQLERCLIERFSHAFKALGRRIVLPQSDDMPPKTMQVCVCFGVSRGVLRQLLFPPISIGRRNITMFGTSVPETAVDKDSHLSASEGDINSAPLPTRYGVLDAVTEASCMQEPS
jgi:hypothetical protein